MSLLCGAGDGTQESGNLRSVNFLGEVKMEPDVLLDPEPGVGESQADSPWVAPHFFTASCCGWLYVGV